MVAFIAVIIIAIVAALVTDWRCEPWGVPSSVMQRHLAIAPPPPCPDSKGVPQPMRIDVARLASEDSGSLTAFSGNKSLGKCVLKHTDVSAHVSGYMARVTVTQSFQNSFNDDVEAIYVFPLDSQAAVDSMTVTNGDHIITGNIHTREDARAIYSAALAKGQTAALLDEERPNIFTQSVANIKPHSSVEVKISYVTLLPFDSGNLTFTFPTVVGPRFIPPAPDAPMYTQDFLKDASLIRPPTVAPTIRSGNDISLHLTIDSASPISDVVSQLHPISIQKNTAREMLVSLLSRATIPNKDFVLSWHVGASSLSSGYLAARDGNGDGYFTLMLMPPDRVKPAQIAPRELIFLVDCSGSQSGLPLQKAKDTLDYIVDHLNPNDTFQIMAFSNNVVTLFEKPEPATSDTLARGHRFISGLEANGGTFMAPAVQSVCAVPADRHRLRIVSFMTDGFVGNDNEILGLVRTLRGTSRWFSFGTGNSVNRFLLDGIAREGGGEAEYVYLNSPSEEVAKKFCEKISSPVLTDVKVSFNGLSVKDVFPPSAADVWAQRPLYYVGRYNHAGKGTVTLTGFAAGRPYTQTLQMTLPKQEATNQIVSTIWAREKVSYLSSLDYSDITGEGTGGKHKSEITKLGLAHHILTPFTSFVAVDQLRKSVKHRTIKSKVPVETPDGVKPEVGLSVDPRYGQSNQVGSYNDVYAGVEKFYGDDIVSNLMQNIGQLIGRWLSEFVNGWVSDSVQLLTSLVKKMMLGGLPGQYDVSDADALRLSSFILHVGEAVRLLAWGGLILIGTKHLREKRLTASAGEPRDIIEKAGLDQQTL